MQCNEECSLNYTGIFVSYSIKTHRITKIPTNRKTKLKYNLQHVEPQPV